MNREIRRIHKFKFYLNASHYVYFDGKQGQSHPHTWEFGLSILDLNDTLREFTIYENAINQLFDRYQNKTMNEEAPFDNLVPTLENMTDYFGSQLREIVRELDGALLDIEGRETPVRSYLLDYSQADNTAERGNGSAGESEDDIFNLILENFCNE